MSTEVEAALRDRLYDCTSATLGAYVKAPKNKPYTEHFIASLVSLPPNLHEYDIAVLDLAAKPTVDISDAEADLEGVSGKSTFAFRSSYPEQVFNSKAHGVKILNNSLRGMLNKEAVSIIFTAANKQVSYDIVEISMAGANLIDQDKVSSLEVCSGHGGFSNKHGKKISLAEKNSKFSGVLSRYLNGAEYDVTFGHPTVWMQGKNVPDQNFIPLLVNAEGQVVGYAAAAEQGFVIVLPQIVNKDKFLVDFFEVLAEVFPKLFPEHGRFSWLDDGSYPLPGEKELRDNRMRVEEEYVSSIAENEAAILELKNEYRFLRAMLTATGDELVAAVEEFLKWLEYPKVKAMDEHGKDVLEEDIQVNLGGGLLVVEVKGIGGTSKDKECSQISKIKHRRQEERQAFDVWALYVVNHQRHLPPRDRINPPFTDHQIGDAKLDKRGLVSTWQLYNVYFDVVAGLISKAAVRAQLLSYGAVTFAPPDLVKVGMVDEIFKGGRVVILNIVGLQLDVGMKLVILKDQIYSTVTVLGLQINGVDVKSVDSGEVGVSVSSEVKKGSLLYVCG